MKIKTFLAAATVAAGLVASSFASAALYTFDGSNVKGSSIKFDGDPAFSISFPDGVGGFDFTINASSAPTTVGLKGNIGPSTLVVGAITVISPAIEVAGVTGSTFVSIFDGVDTLTGVATFDDIVTVGGGTGVNLSMTAGLNVTWDPYSGTHPGLTTIATLIGSTMNLAASFTPGLSLTQLMAKGAKNQTSYAISFAGQPVPEPSTMALLTVGLGMVGFSLARARRR